jgi:hypothetical protein
MRRTLNTVKWIRKSLINMIPDNIVVWKYISSAWQVLDSPYNFYYSAYIPVEPRTTYTLERNDQLYYWSISEYITNSDSGFKKRTGQTLNQWQRTLTITTRSDTNYLRFGFNMYQNVNVTMDMVLAVKYMLYEWV